MEQNLAFGKFNLTITKFWITDINEKLYNHKIGNFISINI